MSICYTCATVCLARARVGVKECRLYSPKPETIEEAARRIAGAAVRDEEE